MNRRPSPHLAVTCAQTPKATAALSIECSRASLQPKPPFELGADSPTLRVTPLSRAGTARPRQTAARRRCCCLSMADSLLRCCSCCRTLRTSRPRPPASCFESEYEQSEAYRPCFIKLSCGSDSVYHAVLPRSSSTRRTAFWLTVPYQHARQRSTREDSSKSKRQNKRAPDLLLMTTLLTLDIRHATASSARQHTGQHDTLHASASITPPPSRSPPLSFPLASHHHSSSSPPSLSSHSSRLSPLPPSSAAAGCRPFVCPRRCRIAVAAER